MNRPCASVATMATNLEIACHLSDVAEMSPPLLSHHLKVLREAGLVIGTKRGRWVDSTLNSNALAELLARVVPETVPS